MGPDILTIRVTQTDIDNAKKHRHKESRTHSCPIAQSLHRRGFKDAWAGFEFLHLGDSEDTSYPYTYAARQFIKTADLNGEDFVVPSTFRLRKAE